MLLELISIADETLSFFSSVYCLTWLRGLLYVGTTIRTLNARFGEHRRFGGRKHKMVYPDILLESMINHQLVYRVWVRVHFLQTSCCWTFKKTLWEKDILYIHTRLPGSKRLKWRDRNQYRYLSLFSDSAPLPLSFRFFLVYWISLPFSMNLPHFFKI